MTPDEDAASARADHSLDQEHQQQQREYQRRMSAPAAYAVVTPDATDARDTLAAAPRPPRRSSLVGAYDYPPSPHQQHQQHQLYQQLTTTPPPTQTASMNNDATASAPSRRSSVVDDRTNQLHTNDADDAAATPFASYLLAPCDSEMTETDANANAENEIDTDGTSRKRTERRTHGCETMFSMDELFSRDLRITGVSKKGTSWRYHIEVLDVRNALMPFTTTDSRDSTAASSPASSSIASMASLPSAPPSSAAYTLPPLVRYTVMRRYNDFRQLYLYLVDYYGPELLDWLPKFPDGGLVSYFRGDDPKLLQFRKEQLQKFLRALDAHDDTKWSRAFRLFLNPEIDELTTIGGASFATLVENYGATPSTTGAPPLSSTTSSSSYWEGGIGLSRINTNSGYVSLSHIKSPEIRFKKQPTDARGDWKRRKIARANRGEDLADSESRGDVKRPRRVKRLELDEPQMHEGNQSDTGDEEEDDDETDSPKKSSTELMKLLSLAPAGEPNQ